MTAREDGYNAEEAPLLPGWLTASQVADALGIARQSVNRLIHEGKFKTLHRLGERPVFIVKTSEVERLKPRYVGRIEARKARTGTK